MCWPDSAGVGYGHAMPAEPKPLPAPTVRGAPYGYPSPACVLDLYLPASRPDGDPPPLIIAIHGGAFLMGDRSRDLAAVPELLALGWAVASIDYRLSGEALFPAAVQDCKAAVRWLRRHAGEHGYDPGRFAAWGRSAGGHLAAMLGTTASTRSRFDEVEPGIHGVSADEVSSEVQAVVNWYGPSDFGLMDAQTAELAPVGCPDEPQVHDLTTSPESLYLGGLVSTVPELVAESNPITHVRPATRLPPFFLAVGDQDCLVPHQQTLILADALREADVPVELHVLHGIGHGGPEFEAAMTPLAVAWLQAAFDD